MVSDLAGYVPRLERLDPREAGVATSLGLGAVGMVTTSAWILVQGPGSFDPGVIWLAGISLLLMVLGLELSRPLDALKTVLPDRAKQGSPTSQRERWTWFKSLTLILVAITAIGAMILFTALILRLGFPYGQGLRDKGPFDRGLGMLALGTTLALIAATVASFRTDYEREPGALHSVASTTLVVTAAAFVLAAGLVAELAPAEGPGIRALDAPFLLLAANTAAAVLVFPSRAIPSPFSMLFDERKHYKGHIHLTLGKSTLLPIAAALALFLFFGLILLIVEVGIGTTMSTVAENGGAQVGLGLFVVALLSAAGGAGYLIVREEEQIIYQDTMDRETKVQLAVLATSATFTLLFGVLAIRVATGNSALGLELPQMYWVDLAAIATLTAVGPYGFYVARRAKRNRRLEERMPEFLRDLAAGRQAGLTLESTVVMAAQGDYGELTPEIEKMADQLSWNMPFSEALKRFRDRVRTPLIERAVSVINEASRTGGNVTAVLEAVAQDAQEIQELKNQRRTTMVVYTGIIYIAFLVFLGVISVLYQTLIPQVLAVSESVGEAGGAGFASIQGGLVLGDYRTFYFVAAVTQGLGNGLVAGLFESGQLKTGLKHAFIMVAISLVVFLLLG